MNNTLELVNLDELLNDEPGCEIKHRTTQCTHHVTHRARSCREQINVCDMAVTLLRHKMATNVICAGCMNFAADCWSIQPI